LLTTWDVVQTTPCPEQKSLQFFMNNFDSFKLSFKIFGTRYPDDTFY